MKTLTRYYCIFAIALLTGLTNLTAIQLPEETEEFRARKYSQPFTKTASGEAYDANCLSCSHLTLPFGTVLRVQNQRTGRSIDVKVNDRHAATFNGIYLSKTAAEKLGITNTETIPVSATPIGLTTAQLMPAKETLQKDAIMVAFDPSAFDESNKAEETFQFSPIHVSLADSGISKDFPPLFPAATTATPTSATAPSTGATHGGNHQRVMFSSNINPPAPAADPQPDFQQMAIPQPMVPVTPTAPLRAKFGAFTNPVQAIELMNALNSQGFETTILSNNQQHNVVTKGTFPSQERANHWINEVERLHGRDLEQIRL